MKPRKTINFQVVFLYNFIKQFWKKYWEKGMRIASMQYYICVQFVNEEQVISKKQSTVFLKSSRKGEVRMSSSAQGDNIFKEEWSLVKKSTNL